MIWCLVNGCSRCREKIAGQPPHIREPVDDAIEAMRRAGRAWIAAGRGNAEAPAAEVPVCSDGGIDDLTTTEAATMLKVTDRRVRQLIASGTLSAHKSNDRHMVDRGTVIAYIERRTA